MISFKCGIKIPLICPILETRKERLRNLSAADKTMWLMCIIMGRNLGSLWLNEGESFSQARECLI